MKGYLVLMVVGLLLFGCFAVVLNNDGKDNKSSSTNNVTPPENKPTQNQTPDQNAPKNIIPPPNPTAYILHAPIRINSDSDPQWGSYPGRVISGYEINGTGMGFCIFIGNCSQPFTVKNCYLHNASGRDVNYFYDTGLYIYKSSNGTLTNDICNGNNIGIYMYFSDTNTLMNNNCSENSHYGTKPGIWLSYSNTNTLTGNNCSGSRYGIFLGAGSNTNTLTNNTCNGNFGGIWLSYSNTNKLTGNNCSKNYHGIYLEFSNTNPLTNNKFQGNTKYGVFISATPAKNRINNNNFINNNAGGKQAYDDSGSNHWNSPYPNGGNYWSDWTTPDIKKGPNQDISGSDGIVDSPYLIDGSAGAKDFYPLTTPPPVPESPPPALALVLLIILPMVVAVRRRREKC